MRLFDRSFRFSIGAVRAVYHDELAALLDPGRVLRGRWLNRHSARYFYHRHTLCRPLCR
ncbi:unnamed protein product [Phaeothamnion confervicola]